MKSNWTWTYQKDNAARLVARGEFTIAEIAERVEVSPETIHKWKRSEEFQSRVAEKVRAYDRAMTEAAIHNVLRTMQIRRMILQRVLEQVESFTEDEYSCLRDRPVAAIDLLLRLQKAVDASARESENLPEDNELPPGWYNDPALSARIVALIKQRKARQEQNDDGEGGRAELL